MTPRWKHVTAYGLWAMSAMLGIGVFLVYTSVLEAVSTDTANVVLGFPAIVLAITGAIVYGD